MIGAGIYTTTVTSRSLEALERKVREEIQVALAEGYETVSVSHAYGPTRPGYQEAWNALIVLRDPRIAPPPVAAQPGDPDLPARVWSLIANALSPTIGPQMGQTAAETYRRALAQVAVEVLPLVFPDRAQPVREDIARWAKGDR